MKRTRLFTALAVFFLVQAAGLAQTWNLVWSDEFTSGIGPDWVFETGTGSGGWGNNELQYYRRENATVANGQLVITAKREAFGGMNYTSARMKTQGKRSWKYGKIEARIAMPAFQGVWPAFWMLGDNITSVGWPSCGEIDVMEHVNTGGAVHGTVHWSAADGSYASYGGNTTTTVTAFHVYAIEWTAGYLRWFVDGVKYHEINIANGVNGTGEFQNNFFILLNLAIGGNWPGFTVDNTAFPANLYVDYVRVYQQGGTQTPAFTTTIQAENYSSMSGVQTETTTDAGGGQNVGWIDTGDWMAYGNVNFPTSGAYTVEYRVASPGGGRLSLDLNGGATVLGTLNVPATGGWQTWTTISHTVNVNAGTYNLGVYAQAGGWNLNWIRITKQTAAREAVAESKGVHPAAARLELYPNPVARRLHLRGSSALPAGRYQVLDARGVAVGSGVLQAEGVDVSALKPGLYSLVVQTADHQKLVRRFVKR
ncbi:MAG TPA: carbohydrate-binding protein [Cytophagales bacterium]